MMRPQKRVKKHPVIPNVMDFECYDQSAESIVSQFTPTEFRTLVMAEKFDIECAKKLAGLCVQCIASEDYEYCAPIRDWFYKNRRILDKLLPDE